MFHCSWDSFPWLSANQNKQRQQIVGPTGNYLWHKFWSLPGMVNKLDGSAMNERFLVFESGFGFGFAFGLLDRLQNGKRQRHIFGLMTKSTESPTCARYSPSLSLSPFLSLSNALAYK